MFLRPTVSERGKHMFRLARYSPGFHGLRDRNHHRRRLLQSAARRLKPLTCTATSKMPGTSHPRLTDVIR